MQEVHKQKTIQIQEIKDCGALKMSFKDTSTAALLLYLFYYRLKVMKADMQYSETNEVESSRLKVYMYIHIYK